MPNFTDFTYNPNQKDVNIRAQNTNPNTPVAPTTPKGELVPTDPLQTAAPDNAGIVPVPKGGMADINKQLYEVSSPKGYATKGEQMMWMYGIPKDWIRPDDAWAFADLPNVKVDESGKIFVKNVVTLKLNDDKIAGLSSLKKDISLVDLTKKQPNSWVGLDINLGPSAEDTLNLADKFMGMQGKKDSPIDNTINKTSGASQKFVDAYTAFVAAATKWWGGTDPEVQATLANLKLALAPMVNSAYAVGSKNMESTDVLDKYQQYIKSVSKFSGFYQQGAEGIKEMSKNVDEYSNFKKIAYKELSQLPSYQAKQKLNNNPAYQSFLEDIAKNNPEKAVQIEQWKSSNTISEDEKNFIDKTVLGPNGFQNLMEARKSAIEQFGVFEGTKMFAWFDDIFEIKKLRYETAEDDYLSNLKTSTDYSWYWLNFSMNDWGMPNYNSSQFSWQSQTGAYTPSKPPTGGYGTVTTWSYG